MKSFLLHLVFILASINTYGQSETLVDIFIDFNDHNPSLTIDNSLPDNQWEIGMPNIDGFDSAYSSPSAICTKLDDNYASNSVSSFQIAVVSERFGSGLLEFVHKYDIEPDVAGGYIELSYDKGNTWHNIVSQGFGMQNLYKSSDIIFNDEAAFNGKIGDWSIVYIDFLWYAIVKGINDWPDGWGLGYENPDTLLIKFNFISNELSTGNPGWLIDNISIRIFDISGEVTHNFPSDYKIVYDDRNGIIRIRSDKGMISDYSTSIYDTKGKKILYIDNSPDYIDISNLPAGLYILNLKEKHGLKQTQKIIKQTDR
jgi:hypothetical protein